MAPRRTSLCLLTPDQLFVLKMRILEGDELARAKFYDATSGCAYALALQILRKAKPAEDVVFRAYSRLWADTPKLKIQHDLLSELVLLVRKFALERRGRRASWEDFWSHPFAGLAHWLGKRSKRRSMIAFPVFPR